MARVIVDMISIVLYNSWENVYLFGVICTRLRDQGTGRSLARHIMAQWSRIRYYPASTPI